MSGDLLFDPATHTYTLDGQVLPGVTQIIGAAGLRDDSWYTEDAALFGKRVHEWTAHRDLGGTEPYPEEIEGQCKAWEKFKAEAKPEILHVEMKIHHPDLPYAGTIDRIAILNSHTWILDIKTGVPQPWHGVQLAAYAFATESIRHRAAVYLREDGTYKVAVDSNTENWGLFYSALNVYSWRKNHGLA